MASLVRGDQREAVRELKYYSVIDAQVDGIDVLLARTGYTGEDGFELYVPNAQAVATVAVPAGCHDDRRRRRPQAWPVATPCDSKPGWRSTGMSSARRRIPTRPASARW